jgi:hypothetical protein
MLDGRAKDERLFVVTPDSNEPSVLAEIGDGRTWGAQIRPNMTKPSIFVR